MRNKNSTKIDYPLRRGNPFVFIENVPYSLDYNYSVRRKQVLLIAFYRGEDKGVEFAGRYFAEIELYIVNLKFSLSLHQFLGPTPTKTPSTAEGKIRSVFNFKSELVAVNYLSPEVPVSFIVPSGLL